jgi:hypothetical protein
VSIDRVINTRDLDIGLPTSEQDIGDWWTNTVDAMPLARRKELAEHLPLNLKK